MGQQSEEQGAQHTPLGGPCVEHGAAANPELPVGGVETQLGSFEDELNNYV